MQPTAYNDANGAQFIIDVPLPSAIKHTLQDRANRFLERHRRHGGNGQLVVHVKKDGRQIACHVHLFSGKENYYGSDTEWDVRQAADEAFDAIGLQQERIHAQH